MNLAKFLQIVLYFLMFTLETYTKTIIRLRLSKYIPTTSGAFELFALGTSVLFLALISLERAFAVLWPVRHRATNTRAYIYSSIIVWVVGVCMFGLSVSSLYHTKVERKYLSVTIHSCLFIYFLVICASYH